MMSKNFLISSFLSATFCLSGCADKADNLPSTVSSTIGNIEITAEDYATVKQFSSRSDERKKAAFASFYERFKMATFLESGELKDDKKLKVDIATSFQQLVLNRYFKSFMEENLTDDRIQAYYDAHKLDFIEKIFSVTAITLRSAPVTSPEQVSNLLERAEEISALIKKGAAIDEIEGVFSSTLELSRKNTTSATLDILRKLEIGQLSDPVEARAGVQLFRLNAVAELDVSEADVLAKARYSLQQDMKAKEYDRIKKLAGL